MGLEYLGLTASEVISLKYHWKALQETAFQLPSLLPGLCWRMREVYRSFPNGKGKKKYFKWCSCESEAEETLSCEGNPTGKDRNAPVPLCSTSNAAAQSQLPRGEWRFLGDYPAKANTLQEPGRCFWRRKMFLTHSSALHMTCLASSKAELV